MGMIGHDFLWRHRAEEKQTCLAECTPALIVFGGEGGVDGTTNQSIRSTHSRERGRAMMMVRAHLLSLLIG